VKRTSLLGRTGEAAAWAISAVAWALSFTAQMQLAGAHGFTSWEVWAWPATTDLAGLTGMLIALDQARKRGSTVVAWLIALAAAAVMVAANIGAAVGDPVAMMLHAWPPSIALASWFLLVHVRRAPKAIVDAHEDAHAPVPVEVADMHVIAAQEETPNGRGPARGNGRPAARNTRTSRARVEAMVRRATTRGRELDARTVAKRLKVSDAHARRLLADARKLHVGERARSGAVL
jgi:hypothetical protein